MTELLMTTRFIHKPSLTDAQLINSQNPDFYYPGEKKLSSISIGSTVKVCDGKERFWVKVIGPSDNKIIGQIINNLVSEQEYNSGDYVEFERKNIYDIVTEPLITSTMWKEDKQKALNVAVAHHLRALQDSMFALRDENGNRPDFDLEDIVNAIYESAVLSRAEFAKYHEMVAEQQRKIDAERLNKDD